MESVIANRYAKALIKLIETDSALEQIAADLSRFAQVYRSNMDFQRLVKEPKFNLNKKVKSIGEIASDLGLSEVLQKFVRFLTAKHRFELIEQVALAFDRLSLERLGKGRAKIISASKLNDTQTKALAAQLSAYTQKDISLEVTVDPTILGGAITQIGSLVFDGSVKTQLNQLGKTISKGN